MYVRATPRNPTPWYHVPSKTPNIRKQASTAPDIHAIITRTHSPRITSCRVASCQKENLPQIPTRDPYDSQLTSEDMSIRILLLPYMPIPPRQNPINLLTLHLRPDSTPPFRTCLSRPSIPVPQHLPNLLLPPLLLLPLQSLHNLLNRILPPLLLICRAIPPHLQLLTSRLLEPPLNLWILLQRLEDIFIGGEERSAEAADCEFEDVHAGEDEDECEPPGEAAAEGAEEGVADEVDGGADGVGGGEDDVPEEPAADGDYEGGEVGGGFGVGFDESGGEGVS